MSITLTPEMLAMLDSKTKDTVIAISKGETNVVSKPKKVLSPEHLAKMKAGREKKLAEKKAVNGAANGAANVEASVDGSSSDSGSAGKKRGPKKLADMTPEERAEHDAKVAARKAAKEAMTPEQKAAEEVKKAAAKAAREAKKAASAPVPVVAVAVPVPVAVAAPVPVPVKVKKTLSPENLAKMAAGREKAKAAKLAAALLAPVDMDALYGPEPVERAASPPKVKAD